jgi:DNA-binding transcriptional ArsR family regulator
MRTSAAIDALIPKTRQAILSATLGAPQRLWYMRELAKHLRLSPSSLQRELASLVRGGILLQRHEGRQVYFKAAVDSPISPELHGLILKTVGLADIVRDALKGLADRIQWAFIYGSVARSEEHSERDVDLMIIGDGGLAEVSSPIRKAEGRLNRAVNPTTYTKDEFAGRTKSNNRIVATLMRSKKLFILGDPREFGGAFGK